MPDDANAMSAEDTFNDVLKSLAAQFKSLTTLEVHTVIANIDVTVTTPTKGPLEVKLANATPPAGGGAPPAAQTASKALYTGANQITGDIQTVWSNSFDPDADTVLYQTHKDNITLSRQIFTGNLKMVGDLIREFAT